MREINDYGFCNRTVKQPKEIEGTMKITTDLSPVDMMIYISTFLNTWKNSSP